MKIGVISDTHGFLDPRVEKIFTGVDHILHAGDIGYASLILELQFIAPVTAVIGNCDSDMDYRSTEIIELAKKKFLVHHIINPFALSETAKTAITKAKPNVVVFGHTHKKYSETIDGVLYFNPGYSGKPKFGAERSVAILHCDESGMRAEYISL